MQTAPNKPVRAQAAFVSDEEVERVMDFFGETQSVPPVQESAFEELTTGAATGRAGQWKAGGRAFAGGCQDRT